MRKVKFYATENRTGEEYPVELGVDIDSKTVEFKKVTFRLEPLEEADKTALMGNDPDSGKPFNYYFKDPRYDLKMVCYLAPSKPINETKTNETKE